MLKYHVLNVTTQPDDVFNLVIEFFSL